MPSSRPFSSKDSTSIDPYSGYFTHQDVLLKWHLPLGLLYDIYTLSTSSSEQDQAHLNQILPFRLTLHFKAPPDSPDVPKPTIINPEPLVLHDSFINSRQRKLISSAQVPPVPSCLSPQPTAKLCGPRHNLSMFPPGLKYTTPCYRPQASGVTCHCESISPRQQN